MAIYKSPNRFYMSSIIHWQLNDLVLWINYTNYNYNIFKLISTKLIEYMKELTH